MHTLTVGDPDQVVTLVSSSSSPPWSAAPIELAVRQAHAAERARDEAETMSAIAGPDLEAEGSLREVLQRARETFRMESVGLLVRQRGSGEWVEVEHVGWAPPGRGGAASL